MYSADQTAVLSIVQKTAKDHGVKLLASRLKITPQTLYSDVDPKSIGRRTNKLGLLDWMVVMEESKNLSSLDQVNKAFKRISLPIPEPTEKMTNMSWLEFCATIAKESAQAVAELASAIQDGKLEPHELDSCEKETWEALQAFAGLYIAIKSHKKK